LPGVRLLGRKYRPAGRLPDLCSVSTCQPGVYYVPAKPGGAGRSDLARDL